MKLNCKFCDIEFISKNKEKIFCSSYCKEEAMKEYVIEKFLNKELNNNINAELEIFWDKD